LPHLLLNLMFSSSFFLSNEHKSRISFIWKFEDISLLEQSYGVTWNYLPSFNIILSCCNVTLFRSLKIRSNRPLVSCRCPVSAVPPVNLFGGVGRREPPIGKSDLRKPRCAHVCQVTLG
jgi:hypothetical protein